MKNQIKTWLPSMFLLFTTSLFAQVPQLNSLPSATATIFLDFDGHTVTGTAWNSNGPIVAEGANMTAQQITVVFNRIAEDYRPFNVNVTTDSTKFLASPLNRRMRAIFTITSSWYGSSGGVAYVNSFSWGDDTPCWIFTALHNYNVKNISEAGSHEVGHTLGLRHQSNYDANCTKISDYHYGQGSGEIGWAPIMGVGYYQNFTLWHNGPNSMGCNSMQNDLDVITSAANGISFRNDDHTDVAATATTANFVNNAFTVNGIIARNDDKDLFKFTMPATGSFKLDAVPYNVGSGNAGSDVDLQIQLLNSAQVIVATYNPGNLLGLVLDTNLNAGMYYLRADGKGNQFAPEYGSLGSYALTGTFTPAAVLPVRRLELKGTGVDTRHQLNWIIDADENVVNQTIEYSTDGRNFVQLSEAPSTSRGFNYVPFTTGNIVYRLRVLFDNNQQFYSNMVAIRQIGIVAKPKLISTLITTKSLAISSPAEFNYVIYDINAQKVMMGTLQQGITHIPFHSSKGMHVIRFSNATLTFTEKFLTQ